MKKTTCAICEIENNSEELYPSHFNIHQIDEKIFSARRLPDKIHYCIVKCKRCGLIRSDPILNEEEIHDLYKKSSLTYQEEIKNIRTTYTRYFKKALPYIPTLGNFLEIGCGNGFFLETAHALGFKNVCGVEPSTEALRKSNPALRKKIVNKLFQPNLFKKETFDIICMFQVFDHLSQPNETLQECHKILRDKGIILGINHNVRSFQSLLLGEKSPIIDIEHPYLYDKKTIKQIYEKNNFEVLKIFNVRNKYSIAYWVNLLPVPTQIKNKVTEILQKRGYNALSFTIYAGNIGIIARKK